MANDRQAEELRYLDLRLKPAQRLVVRAGKSIRLTGSEARLLAALMSEPGRVFSRRELVARAIAGGAIVGQRTIDVHVAGLRRKLGPPDLIEAIRGQGYRLRQSAGDGKD